MVNINIFFNYAQDKKIILNCFDVPNLSNKCCAIELKKRKFATIKTKICANNFFMNYQETLHWMFAKLPVYQFVGSAAYKEDLTNSLLLAKHLGNPEQNIKCIHVAGTNGKGSTSHFLASILQEAGYNVGLFTSPHLKDFRERIKINGNEISEDYVCDFIANHRNFLEKNELSFFEMTVGLAFDYFKNQKVDIAIIEVGLGGRLDSTNIITPLLSVITNIGLDHTAILGNTIGKIAYEKAGIIKNNCPVVIGEYEPETKVIFADKAKNCKSNLYFASDLISEIYPCKLLGDYQIANQKTVLQTITVLNKISEFTVSLHNCKQGIFNVIENTGLAGRWQRLKENPKVICDTAHNEHGLKIVLKQIENEKFGALHIVLGVVNDKNLDLILPLFPKNAIYYFCKPAIARGLDAKVLKTEACKYNLQGALYNSVSDAYKSALQKSNLTDFVFVGGSTFVVAEVL